MLQKKVVAISFKYGKKIFKKQLQFQTSKIITILPGVLLAIGITVVSIVLYRLFDNLLAGQQFPLSQLLLAIILGTLIKSTIKIPVIFHSGINFGLKKLLRFGIILMGIRLSIVEVLKIGSLAVFMIAICIAGALIITLFVAKKLNISQRLGALIAAGTSICGVSAIIAVSPTINAKENETAYAIGVITLFGIAATLLYPYVIGLVFNLSVVEAGFFMGTSVHDTAQVVATSLIYDQIGFNNYKGGLSSADIAITTKLIRNLFMIIVIPFLSFWFRQNKTDSNISSKINIINYIPLFVLGYILMGIARTFGDYVYGNDHLVWTETWLFIKTSATYIITVAITCVGLNTDVKKLVTFGYKPLVCGLIAALSVGGISWVLITQLGQYLKF